jgi:hypothetical protein
MVFFCYSVPSNLGANASLNFCQLEEGINKWTLELEEQEKIFMNQATQVNAWDRLLISNGERVKTLSLDSLLSSLSHLKSWP